MDDVALLARVLGSGTVAKRALARTGGLADLAQCADEELAELVGDARRAKRLRAAFALGARCAALARTVPERMASSADVAAWAADRIASLEHEELWVLALDGRGGLRGARCVGRGGLHGVSVRGPDVLRAALRLGASAFVLVHNHPSGDATPSAEDRAFTTRIHDAAEAVGLPLIDHVVVSRGGFASVPPDAPRSA